jgi:hypothetical protein
METDAIPSSDNSDCRNSRVGRLSRGESYAPHTKRGIVVNDGVPCTLVDAPKFPEIRDREQQSPAVVIKRPSETRSFTTYERHPQSPQVIAESEDDDFIGGLGKRNPSAAHAFKTVSPVPREPPPVRQSNWSQYYTPRHREPIVEYDSGTMSSSSSIVSRRSSSRKDRDSTRRERESTVISLLKEELANSRKLLDVFMEREKREMAEKEKKPVSSPKPNYTIPVSSEPEPEPQKSNFRMLDYEKMDIQEIRLYESKFRNNFNMLRESYPKWNIEVPEIGVIPLKTVHEIYEEIVETIITYQNAMKYRLYLVLAFAAAEYYFFYKQRIRAFENFTTIQIKNLDSWNVYFMSFAKRFHVQGGKENSCPDWMNFCIKLVTSTITIVGMKGAANAMGKKAPDFLVHEAEKFVSPNHGRATLKDDYISEVPSVPTGYQNPDYIIKKAVDFKETVEEFVSAANAPPVEARPVMSKYDEVFE